MRIVGFPFYATAVLGFSIVAFVGDIVMLIAAVVWFTVSWPVCAGVAIAWLAAFWLMGLYSESRRTSMSLPLRIVRVLISVPIASLIGALIGAAIGTALLPEFGGTLGAVIGGGIAAVLMATWVMLDDKSLRHTSSPSSQRITATLGLHAGGQGFESPRLHQEIRI